MPKEDRTAHSSRALSRGRFSQSKDTTRTCEAKTRGEEGRGGSVQKEIVVIADNTVTAHHTVVVVRRMAEGHPLQFQVPMFTW